jgi:hypothetical protein
LRHKEELEPLRAYGKEYADGITWKEEMETVCTFMRDSIEEDRAKRG